MEQARVTMEVIRHMSEQSAEIRELYGMLAEAAELLGHGQSSRARAKERVGWDKKRDAWFEAFSRWRAWRLGGDPVTHPGQSEEPKP